MAISGNKVRVTNISDEHIGLSRPSGAFLRRKGYKPSNLTWATFPGEWVDDKMLALEKEGRLTIRRIDDKGRIIPEVEEQEAPDPEKSEAPPEPDDDADDADEPGEDDSDDADKSSEDDSKGSEVIVEDEVAKAADSAIAKLMPEPNNATVPTVSSGSDGKPVSTNAPDAPAAPDAPDGDSSPTVTEKSDPGGSDDDAVKYTKSSLRKMNLRELREVLEDREINADSTRKDPIIEAILDHQDLGA